MATEILPLQEKLFEMVFRIKAAMPWKQFRHFSVFLSSQPNANETVEEDYAFNHCAYPFFSSLPSHFRVIIASLYLLERKNKKKE